MKNGAKKRPAKDDKITVRLEPAVRKQLESLAVRRDREISYLVRQFINEGLSRTERGA